MPALCLGLSHQKRSKNKTECCRFFCFLSFVLWPSRCLKITEKAVKKTPQSDENQGLGQSWGALGGDLGAFWPPWTPKAGKVPKKLVRCPPLGIPRGTLKSHFFVFLSKSTSLFPVFFQVRLFIDILSIFDSPGPLKYSQITVRYYKIKVFQKSKKLSLGLIFAPFWELRPSIF